MAILTPTYPTLGADRGTEEADVLSVLQLIVGDYNGGITDANISASANIALSKLAQTGALSASTLTLTGGITASGLTATGTVSAGFLNASSTVTGVTGNFTGTVSAATGTFSGNLNRGGKATAVGEETLRVIRGRITGSTGTFINGQGFSSSRISTGRYRIVFTTAFTGGVMVFANALDNITSAYVATPFSTSNTQTDIYITTGGGVVSDQDFNFLVVGV